MIISEVVTLFSYIISIAFLPAYFGVFSFFPFLSFFKGEFWHADEFFFSFVVSFQFYRFLHVN